MSAINLRPKAKKDFELIMDCFSGADGGLSFCDIRALLETFDKKAADGDSGSEQVVQIMQRFASLIRIANSKK